VRITANALKKAIRDAGMEREEAEDDESVQLFPQN
jgi:hypothetical protein